MAGNPILTYLPLNGTLAGTDRNGTFSATGSGALRWQPAEGARVNYVTNPRYAHGTWNYGWGTGGTTTATEETTIAPSGSTKSAKLVTSSGGEGYYSFTKPINTRDASERTLSVLVYKDGTAVTSSDCNIYHNNVLASSPTYESVGGGWYRVWDTFAATAANPNSGIRIEPSKTLYVSNWVLEDGNTTGDYFDGSSAGASWFDPRTGQLGTAHASPSCEQLTAWVEEGTTNLLSNPGVEAATLGSQITAWVGATISKDTTTAYMGTSSVKVVTPGVAVREGVAFVGPPTGLGFTGIRTHRGSIYVRGSGVVDVYTRWQFSDSTVFDSTPVTVTLTNAWQRIVANSHSTDGTKTVDYVFIFVRTSTTVAPQAVTFYCDCAQVEEKAYATSYCDGSLGTGYSWAGTAHASTSTRSSSDIQFPIAGHIDVNNGTMLSHVNMVPSGTQASTAEFVNLWVVGGWITTAGKDGMVGYHKLSSQDLAVGLGTNGTNPGYWPVIDVPRDSVFRTLYAMWNATTNMGGFDNVALVTGPRAAPSGVWMGPTVFLRGPGASGGELLGPVALYDAPLSDARRALVNTAIDNYDDLWSLFETRRIRAQFELRPAY